MERWEAGLTAVIIQAFLPSVNFDQAPTWGPRGLPRPQQGGLAEPPHCPCPCASLCPHTSRAPARATSLPSTPHPPPLSLRSPRCQGWGGGLGKALHVLSAPPPGLWAAGGRQVITTLVLEGVSYVRRTMVTVPVPGLYLDGPCGHCGIP